MYKMSEQLFYNWSKTFSYNSPFNIVISSRGYGKTFGLRKTCVDDFKKDGSRFVEIVRYSSELEVLESGYFDKLQQEGFFLEYDFKIKGHKGYIAKKETPDKWELLCYFFVLSQSQRNKKSTFANVKRIIFDEFTLERKTRPGYLPNEPQKLINAIDTIARQKAGEKTKVKVYLLGNAVDMTNPYFWFFGSRSIPEYGYTWLKKNWVLLHYAESKEYSQAKKDTLVGHLVEGTEEERIIVNNEFANSDMGNIEDKTKNAKFDFGFKFLSNTLGVWIDWNESIVYVNEKVPNNTNAPIYALTTQDNNINLLSARRSEPKLKMLVDMYYAGLVRYSSHAVREKTYKALSLFGVIY